MSLILSKLVTLTLVRFCFFLPPFLLIRRPRTSTQTNQRFPCSSAFPRLRWGPSGSRETICWLCGSRQCLRNWWYFLAFIFLLLIPETLAFATFSELLDTMKEIQYMERKPKKLGLLIWMLTVCFGYTHLPFCYAFEMLKYLSLLPFSYLFSILIDKERRSENSCRGFATPCEETPRLSLYSLLHCWFWFFLVRYCVQCYERTLLHSFPFHLLIISVCTMGNT